MSVCVGELCQNAVFHSTFIFFVVFPGFARLSHVFRPHRKTGKRSLSPVFRRLSSSITYLHFIACRGRIEYLTRGMFIIVYVKLL